MDALPRGKYRNAQRTLLTAAIDLALPFIEKMATLIVLLEKWTCRKKELERVELLKAAGQYDPEPNQEEKDADPEVQEEFYEDLKDPQV